MKKTSSAPFVFIMAIAQNPITGRMKNTLGNAVASTWNGLNIFRSKALTVANPKTEGQRINRQRISALAGIGKMFAAAIMYGYRQVPTGSSSRSFFNKQNYPFVTVPVVDQEPIIDFANLALSIGGLSVVSPSAYAINGGDTAVVASFPTTVSNPDESVNDDICLMTLVVKANKSSFTKFSKVKRSTGTVTTAFGSALALGDKVYSYLFASSALSAKASNSVFYTTTV